MRRKRIFVFLTAFFALVPALAFSSSVLDSLEVRKDQEAVSSLAGPVPPLSDQEISLFFKKLDAKETFSAPFLHRALSAPHFTVRTQAARLLGTQGDSSSIPYLIDALSDESLYVGADFSRAGLNTVRYWANESLKALTHQDFNFLWDDPLPKRMRAIK